MGSRLKGFEKYSEVELIMALGWNQGTSGDICQKLVVCVSSCATEHCSDQQLFAEIITCACKPHFLSDKMSCSCSKYLDMVLVAVKTRKVQYSPAIYPLLPLLDLVFVGAGSLEVDFFGVSFSCSTGPASSNTSFVFAAAFAMPPLFFGSTWPMSGISDASHCWKGFATKNPSTSNHRVKGEESLSVVLSP